ncbi:PREDICTED: fibrous sheath CABYR-binding protein-like [Gavialis gangeticus]|uniref:fibrous sheath CABYR-binding protein-like n=1 Tax=Gavialis gangeticus TaxID=94835 RepID=UPI00092F0E04|nr:PREDICTED: fibrous sheath CABYR-binding protein-like [Gavialis gangeticus]
MGSTFSKKKGFRTLLRSKMQKTKANETLPVQTLQDAATWTGENHFPPKDMEETPQAIKVPPAAQTEHGTGENKAKLDAEPAARVLEENTETCLTELHGQEAEVPPAAEMPQETEAPAQMMPNGQPAPQTVQEQGECLDETGKEHPAPHLAEGSRPVSQAGQETAEAKPVAHTIIEAEVHVPSEMQPAMEPMGESGAVPAVESKREAEVERTAEMTPAGESALQDDDVQRTVAVPSTVQATEATKEAEPDCQETQALTAQTTRESQAAQNVAEDKPATRVDTVPQVMQETQQHPATVQPDLQTTQESEAQPSERNDQDTDQSEALAAMQAVQETPCCPAEALLAQQVGQESAQATEDIPVCEGTTQPAAEESSEASVDTADAATCKGADNLPLAQSSTSSAQTLWGAKEGIAVCPPAARPTEELREAEPALQRMRETVRIGILHIVTRGSRLRPQ